MYCEQSGVSGWLLCIVNSLVIGLATVYCEQSGYLVGYCVL